MKLSPSPASCRSLWYIRRQIFVAGRMTLQRQPEGLDDHQVVVADFLERIEGFVPADVAGPRRAAVVFRMWT